MCQELFLLGIGHFGLTIIFFKNFFESSKHIDENWFSNVWPSKFLTMLWSKVSSEKTLGEKGTWWPCNVGYIEIVPTLFKIVGGIHKDSFSVTYNHI